MSEEKFIPYGRQVIGDDDISAVAETMKSDYLTTGPKVGEFESALCKFTGAKHAIAVNSGTSALDIAVASLAIPPGSEIITTPFTFAASANCILYNKCMPVFADIKIGTFNIDPKRVEEKITGKTKAIICVDYAGHPCDMDSLRAIAKKHNLHLIEDAAHSLGGEYKGKKVGALADLTCLSFHPVKQMTTGEGGAVLAESDSCAKTLKMLRNHGIDKTPSERVTYEYDMLLLGRNYRLSDIHCALGISQLKKLPGFLKRRKEIAKYYDDAFRNMEGISLQKVSGDVSHAHHLYPVLLPEGIGRDKVFGEMRKRQVGVNVHYIPVYRLGYYKKFGISKEDYPVTEEVFSRVITVPLHCAMSDDDCARVVKSLEDSIGEVKGK